MTITPHAPAETRLAETVRALAPRAILFDLDGTLVDSAESNFRALQSAWAVQGAALDRDWYSRKTGLSVAALARAWHEETGLPIDPDGAIEGFLNASVAEAPQARLFDDTSALLQDTWARMPVGLVTNNFRPIVTALVESVLAPARFAAIVTADAPGLRPKPAPDLYARAVADLALPGPACLALEDSNEGLAAARAAGLKALDVRAFRV